MRCRVAFAALLLAAALLAFSARPPRQDMKQCGGCESWNEADRTVCRNCGASI